VDAPPTSRFSSPQQYTPKHLADRILTSKSALEGERKQVTVLFADLKGSMELLADRDPEEARKLRDPVLEKMMEAVHRYEGTVNQVMGDGIMGYSARRSLMKTTQCARAMAHCECRNR
jgi:class 3 adenylate cyclase